IQVGNLTDSAEIQRPRFLDDCMTSLPTNVLIERCPDYDAEDVDAVLEQWDALFSKSVKPGSSVVLKPNWIAASHKYDQNEWMSVITHPMIITSVLRCVLKHLRGSENVVIIDGPQAQSSWRDIMARMTADLWVTMGREAGVKVDIVDLRDDEWTTDRDVIVSRRKLAGDPRGSTACDLSGFSE